MTTSTTPIPVIPTLGSTTFITDVPTAIAYQLRHYFSSPKGLMETYYPVQISCVDVMSKYAGDYNTICNAITNDLTNVFSRIYPNGSLLLEVLPQTTDGVNYNISIDITITLNGAAYNILNTIGVTADGRMIINGDTNE